jgi:hypothetical protein
VRFLAKPDDSESLRRLSGRHQTEPAVTLYYTSGDVPYMNAAERIAKALGTYEEAVLICTGLPWGDFWNTGNVRWQAYYDWRKASGDRRRLYDAPMHMFGSGELDQLRQALVFAFELGWDAELLSRPGRCRLVLSHDDRMAIFRLPHKRRLEHQLKALGFCPR